MKYEIDFPDLGCHCVRTRNDEYRFCVYDFTRREIIKIPLNVNGIPVTEVFFERDGSWFMHLKKVFITKIIRKIGKADHCYKDTIPELIIDEDNPYFRVHEGVLYRGRRLLFATNLCGITYEVLPSTTEICDSALNGCLHKVILPAGIRKVGYDALSNCSHIEVFDNTSADIRAANYFGFELIVRSYKSGRLLYKIFFPQYEYRNYHITENRSAGDLNFEFYDSIFENLTHDISEYEKLMVCLDRLMYPYRLSKEAEARYKKFISDNNTYAVKMAINEDKQDRLCFLLELGAVVPENLEELTEYCVQRGKTEFTALLLNYKNENFPDLPPNFSLE